LCREVTSLCTAELTKSMSDEGREEFRCAYLIVITDGLEMECIAFLTF
jgi:hypothetical protein